MALISNIQSRVRGEVGYLLGARPPKSAISTTSTSDHPKNSKRTLLLLKWVFVVMILLMAINVRMNLSAIRAISEESLLSRYEASRNGDSTHHESSPSTSSSLESHYDVCIAGAGLSGSVLAERYATQLKNKKKILVVEKRDHIGGNCFDYIDQDTGIRVSKYGAHLFHTKYPRVWNYIRQFGEFTPYQHKVTGLVNGKNVPIPVNIETVNTLFSTNISTPEEMDAWLKQEQITTSAEKPQNSEEVALSRVGPRLYDLIFKPYTFKQWAKYPAELGPEVLSRIPVRNNWDGRYFSDPYQAIPTDGYTSLFHRMLDRPEITVNTNTDFFQVRNKTVCDRIYFTGPIDSYFAYLGWPKLEYRSLDFERKVEKNVDYFQPGFVVNHPQTNDDYTRIVEYKHLLNQSSPHTVYFIERSKDDGEPYYPVPNKKNKDLYRRYQEMAAKEEGVDFVGRLASYKYFNMDEAIKNALEVFDRDTTGMEMATNVPGLVVPTEQLPDWMISTRCSAFSLDCMAHAQRQNTFQEYPFRFGSRLKELDGIVQLEDMPQIPNDWTTLLARPPVPVPSSTNYVYPPEASRSAFKACMADTENLSWQEQLEKLMSTGVVRIDPETGMVAFTLSDWKYAYDMTHDVYEMARKTVGFSDSFFMVAFDKNTTEMACRYNYPVVSWTSGSIPTTGSDGTAPDIISLKAAVGNAKFEVSYELVRRGLSFFFFEMDVWFLRSPKPILLRFLDSDHDVIFSSHQDNPHGPNIGAYGVKAKKSTEEYFHLSIKMTTESPATHDQFVMAEVARLFMRTKLRTNFSWGGAWEEPKPSTIMPKVEYPFTFAYFTGHHFAADMHPIITEQTIAIHTLCGGPLRTPHGKKMVAKERGAWYGFEGPTGEGGYYSRKGEGRRRYLWMDGHVLNGYSLTMEWDLETDSGLYHSEQCLRWTIATMIALARRTNRIFVLPKILDNHYTQFLWVRLDLQSVEELGVDVRETTFPTNPKAWHSASEPFRKVARTALGHDKILFYTNPEDDTVRGWKLDLGNETSQVDAFYAMHETPEMNSSELLLVNARYINGAYVDRMRARYKKERKNSNRSISTMGLAEREIVEIYKQLRWCTNERNFVMSSVERTHAEHDCYGSGTTPTDIK